MTHFVLLIALVAAGSTAACMHPSPQSMEPDTAVTGGAPDQGSADASDTRTDRSPNVSDTRTDRGPDVDDAAAVTDGATDATDDAAASQICKEALVVTRDQCGLDTDEDPGESRPCTGDEQARAECIVGHPDAFCEWNEELATGEFDFTNEYTDCLEAAGISG